MLCVQCVGSTIQALVLRDPPLVMQLEGWEWDPRRLCVVSEDGDDEEGEARVVWDRFDTDCANHGMERYLEIMGQVEEIEPDDSEFDQSDSDDSDDEEEHKHQAALRATSVSCISLTCG